MRALLLLLASTLVLRADEPLPTSLAGQEGLYQSYLSNFLQGETIKDANEKRLLMKLNSSEQSNFSLLCYLGYVGKVHYQSSGSIQYPGQSPEPTFSDMGYVKAQGSRMKLQGYFEDQKQGLRIYVFCAAYPSWPGMNNTCVILTTPEDYPLDWRGHAQSDMLEGCAYDSVAQKLSLTCKRRGGGEETYVYTVQRLHVELSQ